MNKKIELILQKYFEGSISDIDLLFLKDWIAIDKNKKAFQDFIEMQYLLDYKYLEFDLQKAEKQFNVTLNKKSVISLNKKPRFKYLLKYAAFFIGIIGISFFIKNQFQTSNVLVSEEFITIQLDNGNVEIISETGERKILNKNGKVVGIQKGNILKYNQNASQTKNVNSSPLEKLAYNELSIPYGKTFKLELYDGTIVHLNAGSSLKYPIKFLEGKERKIFLSGEAHFEVAKDSIHPFIVNSNNFNVRALGTQFNVSSYDEDTEISTVLVEGSVGVYSNDEGFDLESSLILNPGQKADWDKKNKDIAVKNVDTTIYTGWINGKMIFNHMAFNKIRKILERHYNVSIVNNNQLLDKEVFTATFDIETIEQVLHSFSKNYELEFSIENDQIIIN